MSGRERALTIVQSAARVRVHELRDNAGARTAGRMVRKRTNQAGHTQGALERAAKPPIGWIWGDFFRPWHRMFPSVSNFNALTNVRREFVPLSLVELSRLIELGWIDKEKPIDLPALCATGRIRVDSVGRQVGIMLTPEGASSFAHRVDLEVQSACVRGIAAVERARGRIRVAYVDQTAIEAAANAQKWIEEGRPIPPRRQPPSSLMQYYSDPSNRGYLAEQKHIEEARAQLAQLMGYEYTPEPEFPQKDVSQVFHGIPAGSVISLTDRKVFAPSHPSLRGFYADLRSPNRLPV